MLCLKFLFVSYPDIIESAKVFKKGDSVVVVDLKESAAKRFNGCNGIVKLLEGDRVVVCCQVGAEQIHAKLRPCNLKMATNILDI